MRSVLHHRRMRIAALAFSLGCLAMAAPGRAMAADNTGNYSVRGIGSSTCQQYAGAVDGNTPDLRGFIAWMEGALTTVNRLSPNLFDAVPFNSAGAFAAVVLQICRQAPALQFNAALMRGLERMNPIRVTTNSPWVEMTVGTNRVTLRAETLAGAQARLGALGLLSTPPDGRFTVATRDAIKRFQQIRRMNVTELPDPDTIMALMVGR
ncbi:peptidoglycan-binding domain-containing protein [Falsiroseomonas selenitidurans]|uniref:Peptidoglycan-binding protein n=1 Tax=Falsiroseomonas selenitidurans TaxID=2716335 RepID=A0ABX1ECZ9_9PROT|nr:peptidoglycan-binding domain-containing protein [Falsiroseomonas selenitidurans]NKC33397.1 peptidoglycan-binding protein [Falsiroseomonas selenitidurans]